MQLVKQMDRKAIIMSTLKAEQFIIGKKQLLSYLFIFSLVFADIFGNGNLNLLYFFGAFLIIKDFKIKRSFLKDLAIYFVPFCIIVLGEIFFSGNSFSFGKIIVYCFKILVCVSLLSYTKNNFWKANHLKIIEYICVSFGFLLILSLLTIKFPIFWRLDDTFNNFSKTRLKFLYSEPSVLGILCGLLVIILMHYVFSEKRNRIIIREVLLLSVIILLTFSMSGIVYTAVAVIVLYFFEILKRRQCISGKLLVYLLIGVCMLVLILITNNPISKRFFSMFLGMDGSYNFRWSAAVSTFSKIMNKTEYWGMGLGNMNTPSGLFFLSNLGINYKFANSFLYFSAENGFLGIAYIVYLFLICIKSCVRSTKNNRPLKVGLLVFAFVSQIAGGYFTDPILWIIYGIICSREFGADKVFLIMEKN